MARYNSEDKTNEETHTSDGRLPAVCSSFPACMTGLAFSHRCYATESPCFSSICTVGLI
jgi:hypothetical protein